MAHKKGQLSVDFYVAIILFIGMLAYITFQLFQIMPASSANLKDESVKIEAYQLSELLVNDGGHPNDWYDNVKYPSAASIKRIGLSDSTTNVTNYLSREKVERFKTLCSSFNNIKTLLDIKDETIFTIIEHKLTGDDIFTCKSSVQSTKKTSFNVVRTVLIAGTSYPTEIITEVWKI